MSHTLTIESSGRKISIVANSDVIDRITVAGNRVTLPAGCAIESILDDGSGWIIDTGSKPTISTVNRNADASVWDRLGQVPIADRGTNAEYDSDANALVAAIARGRILEARDKAVTEAIASIRTRMRSSGRYLEANARNLALDDAANAVEDAREAAK